MINNERTNVFDEWVEWPIGVLTISVPGDWGMISDGGETVVIGHQDAPEGVFSPNTVIRQTPTNATLTALASEAIATTIAAFDGAHFIANDIAEIDGHAARAQIFTYDAGGYSIVVHRRLALVGNLGVEITTSFTVGQSEVLGPVADAIAANVAIDRSVGLAVAAADSDGTEALPEPCRDEFMATVGHDVERVSRIGTAQPFTSQGPVVSEEGVQFLLDHRSAKKLGKFQLLRIGKLRAELVDAGFMDPRGQLTDRFRFHALALEQSPHLIQIEAHYGAIDTSLTVWMGWDQALIAAGPSYSQIVLGSEEDAIDLEKVRLDVVDPAQLPGVIASWTGLAPAWTVQMSPDRIDMETFGQRMEGSAPVPDASDELLARLWAEPWFAWRLTAEATHLARAWLNAGAAGYYAMGVESDGMVLSAVPSVVVWQALLQDVGELARAR